MEQYSENKIIRIHEFIDEIVRECYKRDEIVEPLIKLLCNFGGISIDKYRFYSSNTNSGIIMHILNQFGVMASTAEIANVVKLVPIEVNARLKVIVNEILEVVTTIMKQREKLLRKRLTTDMKIEDFDNVVKERQKIVAQIELEHVDYEECSKLLRDMILRTINGLTTYRGPNDIKIEWTTTLASVTTMKTELAFIVHKNLCAPIEAELVPSVTRSPSFSFLLPALFLPLLKSTAKVMNQKGNDVLSGSYLNWEKKSAARSLFNNIGMFARAAMEVSKVLEMIYEEDKIELQQLEEQITHMDKKMSAIEDLKDVLLALEMTIKDNSDHLENLYRKHERLIDSAADQ